MKDPSVNQVLSHQEQVEAARRDFQLWCQQQDRLPSHEEEAFAWRAWLEAKGIKPLSAT